MKQYYLARLHWIFNYTSTKWWYIIAKTLCLLIGVPIYAVCFVVEMVLTFVNMLFSWIPILNVVVMFICKILITVFGSTFYICILPDIKGYKQASKEVNYVVLDDDEQPDTTDELQSQTEVEQTPTDTENTEE